MALVSFKEGTKQVIKNAPYIEGSFYYATDTHEIAFDIGGSRQWHEHSEYMSLDSIDAAFDDTDLKIDIDKKSSVSTTYSSYHYEIGVDEANKTLTIIPK